MFDWLRKFVAERRGWRWCICPVCRKGFAANHWGGIIPCSPREYMLTCSREECVNVSVKRTDEFISKAEKRSWSGYPAMVNEKEFILPDGVPDYADLSVEWSNKYDRMHVCASWVELPVILPNDL